MKKLAAAAIALVIATIVACSAQSVAPNRMRDSTLHRDQVGDACTTSDGRSGYLVNAGRDLVCSAT